MYRKISSFLIIASLLISALSVVYAVKPTLAQNSSLFLGSAENLKPASSQPTSEPKASEVSAEPDQQRDDAWNRIGIDRFSNFTYMAGNVTRLVVGVDERKQPGISELEKVASQYQAKFVNTVTMGGKVRAVVFELSLTSVEGFVERLHTTGLATYVEPNMKVQAQIVPDDPYWIQQWGPQKIEADWAWNTTVGDPSVLVSVVDTGIYYYHPDIAPNYAALGLDWVNNDTDPLDDHGHGTHCSGIIAAVLNNSEGIAGLAQARVMGEKVLDSYGYGYADWVANAIAHSTDVGAKIISMSIGGWGDSELIHDAVKYAYDAGVLVIAAAGNSNSDIKPYPAGYEEVIAVAATDWADNKASFSNWGDWIELSAPGVDIWSSVIGGYASWSGTSMACPHVAGVAALVWSVYPNRTRDWLRIWLRYTADDLGQPGFDPSFGYGRVNARKAVEMPPPAHELIAYDWTTPPYVEPGTQGAINATILNFGENESDVTVELLANDTVVTSATVDFLPAGSSTEVSLVWNPVIEGEYNVTLYVVPMMGETSVENNVLRKHIYVGFPVKAVVLHSAGNVRAESITSWQAISNEWYLFGDTMVYIDYTSLNKQIITYEDIVATEADALIISCAYDPFAGWQFTDSEIAAITRYIHEGHGLVATAGTFYYQVPNNKKLASLFGLNTTITWTTAGTDLMHLLNETHPIFDHVPNPLVFPGVTTSLPYDGLWDQNELVNGEYLAVGHYEESAVVEYRGLVYISPYLEIIPPYYKHHLQLLYNAIKWSRYEKPQHELTVSLESPKHLKPGESTLINATVSNQGLSNETDVEIRLMMDGVTVDTETVPLLANGTSHTIEYLWSPSEGIYNITAYAPPVPGESELDDNAATYIVRVSSATGLVLFEEAHLPSYTIGTNPAADVSGGYSEFANYLITNGFTVSTIDPGTEVTLDVLAPAAVVVIVAPYRSYLLSELDAIENWVRNGGRLLLVSDWGGFGLPARTIATRFGITLQGDGLCDSDDNVGYSLGAVYDDRNIVPHAVTAGVTRIEIYAGDGIISQPADAMPLIVTDTDGTAYWYSSGLQASGVSVASAFDGGTIGCGKLIMMTDSNLWDSAIDADGDGLIDFYDSDNAILGLNCVDWLSVRYQHDLSVRLDAPSFVSPGKSVQLNATVQNLGLNNETNVELLLLINDTVIESTTISELLTCQGYVIHHVWTPTLDGTYNITVYAPVISSEASSTNNVATRLVIVRPTTYVLFDQTHGTTSIGLFGSWVTSLTQRGYVIDSLTTSPITSGLLQDYNVLVIPQAYNPYTPEELSAIQTFVLNGGGLLVIGDDYPWIYTDLTGFAGILWWSGGMSGTTTDITPHAVTTGVSSVYLLAPVAYMDVAEVAQGLIKDPGQNIMLAVSEQPGGKVIGFSDEDTLADYGINQADNLRLADNMIDWLAISIPLEHDLAVSVEAPKYLQAGESILVNATVRNRGINNETNVELRVLVNDTQVDSALIPELNTGASYSLSTTLGPFGAGTKSNFTAYSPPLSGENVTSNNYASKTIIVPFYRRTYLSPQWVDGGTRMNWSADDNSWAYVLPFDFPFYGVYYQTIYISSNGLITFTGPDSGFSNSIDQLRSKLALAVAWDDWITGDPYDIYIWQNMTHVGIRWNVRHLSSSYTANFEAILGIDGVIQLDYAYNDGPISATIGISDGNGEIIAEDATILNYIDTVLFTPPMHEHELVVTLKTPKHLKPSEPALVNATVRNLGLNNESGVELQLLIDDTVVDLAIIQDLSIGQFCTLEYTWTPTGEGTFNITAYAPPVPSEDLTENNFATKLVDVQETRGLVLFDQTHWTDYWMSYSIWITVLTNREYIVDPLLSGPITPAVLEGYDVFIIPQAHASYTLDELAAIQTFVTNGKGLLVIGDDYPWAYNDLTGFAGIGWASGEGGGIATDVTPHAVTQDVSTVYLIGLYAQISVSPPALDLIRDQNGSIMLAVSEVGAGRVVGFVGADSIMDWSIDSGDNLMLALNMVEWLASQAGSVGDVAVTDLNVWPSEVYRGHDIYANVTVANLGNVSMTFNVSLYCEDNLIATQPVTDLLPNVTLTLNFSWDTTLMMTGQNYTMKAAATIIPGETDTDNNLFIDGLVTIRMLGDINNDGKVNLLDAVKAALTFGATPSDPRWDRFCDICEDNCINILDIIVIGMNFGRGY